MRTIAYIDGFNLDYRMLRGRPEYKWLDPKALATIVLSPSHQITRAKQSISARYPQCLR